MKLTGDQIKEAVELRKIGWSLARMAEKLNADSSTIHYHLKKNGLSGARAGRKPKTIRSETEKAHTHKNGKTKFVGKLYKDYVRENKDRIFVRDEIGNLVRVETGDKIGIASSQCLL